MRDIVRSAGNRMQLSLRLVRSELEQALINKPGCLPRCEEKATVWYMKWLA